LAAQQTVGAQVGLATDDTAILHCIEPVPQTANALSRSAKKLKWDKRYIVSNMAMSNVDGTVLFPSGAHLGVETPSLSDCLVNPDIECVNVTVSRVDTYLAKHFPDPQTIIDFLSIDTEGFDWEVIMGSLKSLRRVKYLEFEYHSVNNWVKHKLSDAIKIMTDHKFVCYWAGAYGHLWRISDCWMDYYNVHGFSNVACVNLGFAENAPLLTRMEELFQATLQAGNKIDYGSSASLFTDGGFRYPEFADTEPKR
jgi:FkbM family methyltransferase